MKKIIMNQKAKIKPSQMFVYNPAAALWRYK